MDGLVCCRFAECVTVAVLLHLVNSDNNKALMRPVPGTKVLMEQFCPQGGLSVWSPLKKIILHESYILKLVIVVIMMI